MRQQLALITGGNAGIGRAAAAQLLARGWEVVIATRRPSAGEAAVESLGRGGGLISWVELDLARLESVRACAAELRERRPRLDALINNAGTVRSARELSVDGFELTFQTNHLGHFLLTHLLHEPLAAEAGRVVNVTSTMHTRSKGIDFDDLQMERGYGLMRAYADTKLAGVYFARELARRWAGQGVTANAVHPGGVRTELGGGGELRGPAGWGWWLASRFMRSPGSGAKPVVRLAADDDVADVSGAYFDRFKQRRVSGIAADDEAARRLWEVSAELAGDLTP